MTPARPSHRETLTSLAVLVLLFAIGLGVVLVRQHPNPAVLALKRAGDEPAGFSALSHGHRGDRVPVPPGFSAMGPAEVYDPARLSDKIDGKAELYLSAGVEQLTARRLAAEGGQPWMEVFVYRMASPKDAYAVYSAQYRQGAAPAGISTFSYLAENALFFVHGAYYVEIISSSTGPEAAERLAQVGTEFVRAHPAKDAVAAELSLFPPEGLVAGSIALQPADVFGFQGLDDVFLARYRIDEAELTAFVSVRESAGAAEALAADYVAFLERFGGRAAAYPFPAAGAQLVEIFDTYELVFTHGRTLAGVHEAEDPRQADLLGRRILKRLAGKRP